MALTKEQEEMLRLAGGSQLSPEQLAMVGPATTPKPEPDSQLLRTGLQGFTFGFSDEIEAATRSAVNSVAQSVGLTDQAQGYAEIRDEIRKQLTDYKTANPNSALTAEVVGALVPAVVSMVLTGGASAPVALPSLARVAGVSAGQGLLTGAGTSEKKDVGGILSDTAAGGGLGLVAGPLVSGIGKGIVKGAGALIDFAREKFGKQASTAVTKELQSLAEQSGKSVDQIVNDLASGRVMADNKTLTVALKDLMNQGGETRKYITEQAGKRAATTEVDALKSMKDILAPTLESNVVRGFTRNEDVVKRAASASYNKIYRDAPNLAVTKELSDNMTQAVQILPNLMDKANAAYAVDNLVPLFVKRKNGAIEMIRRPTLQDAEILRGKVKDESISLFKTDPGFARDVLKLENKLRQPIDSISTALRDTRAKWANIKASSEAFSEGKKALRTNADDVEMAVTVLRQNPNQFNAYKAGIMHDIRAKMLAKGNTLEDLASENKQIGAVLKNVLSETEVASLTGKLSLAGESRAINQVLQPLAGSLTTPLAQARRASGSQMSASDLTGVVKNFGTGNWSGVAQSLSRMLPDATPQLNDIQRRKVAELLYSQDPSAVQKALTDRASFDKFLTGIPAISQLLARGVPRATTFEVANQQSGLLNSIGAK